MNYYFYFLSLIFLGFINPILGQSISEKYQLYFYHFNTNLERSCCGTYTQLGHSEEMKGRSFALLIGGNHSTTKTIQNEVVEDQKLFNHDINKLKIYLKYYERYDEIVVLENEEVTAENLKYFLQNYFPKQIKQFPHAKFLFAYSGLEVNISEKSYLSTHSKQDLDIHILEKWLEEIASKSHCSLALIHTFHNNAFQAKDQDAVFSQKNHLITVTVKTGKIPTDSTPKNDSFFDVFLEALEGKNSQQDFLTINTLHQQISNTISIQESNISTNQKPSEFSFLNRGKLLEKGLVKPWNDATWNWEKGELAYFSDFPKMILVKGGTYQMGCLNIKFANEQKIKLGCEDDEKPAHQVTLPDFYLAETEITAGQFRAFIDDTCYLTDAEKIGGSYEWDEQQRKWLLRFGLNWRFGSDMQLLALENHDLPVVHVSWNDAKAYCDWLTKKTGKSWRLPTEAEWEYAARGGGKNYVFSWGNGAPNGNIADETAKGKFNWEEIFDQYEDGYIYAAPVASFSPNELGLYDLSGNVWEWCQDWYAENYYDQSPIVHPKGPSEGTKKVLRGGSWRYAPMLLRTGYRGSDSPDFSCYDLGFRVVRED
jgi:formylglycine-generating enzyme required for sulfatase activity